MGAKKNLTKEEKEAKKAKRLAKLMPSENSAPAPLTDKEKKEQLERMMFGEVRKDTSTGEEVFYESPTVTKTDLKAQVRVGGSKGSTGKQDHTAGKCQFARPCTVGWKSQNQPLAKGGGNRTPL